MLYNTRRGPDFEASQWNKNGDHPEDYAQDVESLENGEPRIWTGQEAKDLEWEGQIVRYFRQPDPKYSGDKVCPVCGKLYHDHGWIEDDKLYKVHGSELITQITFGELTPEGTVCPGSFIATFYQFGEKDMAGSKPEMVKRYSIIPERTFRQLYVAVDNV